MYHSVTFGEKNTWDDWYIIPTSRPVIAPPDKNTNIVEIPGMNGVLDLSEALTGYPTYQNRTGSLEFIVANNQLDISPADRTFGFKRWNVLYSEIMDYLHGKSMEMLLEDDKGYVYVGTYQVNEWKSEEIQSVITIDYDVYPFKKERYSSLEPWYWDPFDFETGIIRNYSDILVSGTKNLTIPLTREYITPIFICSNIGSSGLIVTYEKKEYQLYDGKNYIPEIIIGCPVGNRELTLIFKGAGKVSVDYRGGVL